MYSNSANGSTSSWIVRTSTPRKMSVYDFDNGRPSTSFDPTVSLQRLDPAGQSSSKPKGRNQGKLRKGSIISMICEAIEAIGSSNKGASYIGIHKWIANNRKNGEARNLRTLIRKEIAKGLKLGLLKRSSVSKKSVGVKGYFIINENYSSNHSRKSVRIPKLKIIKNVNMVKPNKVETVRSIQRLQEDQTPQSVLAAIMKTKDAFEETAQSILQQAYKVLEEATKLMTASNSLVLNKVTEENRDAINPEVEMQCVAPIQSLQDEEARVAPMQSSRSENRVAQINAYQAEKEQVTPISKDEEAQVVPIVVKVALQNEEYTLASMQYPLGGENRVVGTNSSQDELLRVARMQSQDEEARVASMQFLTGEARVAPMQLAQGEARVAPMQLAQGEARVAPMQVVQSEARVALKRIQLNDHKVAPMQSSVENRVVGTPSPQDELRVSRKALSQIGEAQVLEEEHSVQRSLNFSLDLSFGVEAEVSNLIEHLEENL